MIWNSGCIVWCKWRFLSYTWCDELIGLVSPVEWNVYEVCPPDMHLQVSQFFPHRFEPRGWLCCLGLRSLALTRKSLRLLQRLSATGRWNKDAKMFANNGWDETKGCVVGDNEGNTFWFVQCGTVLVILLTRCISREGNSDYSHVCKDSQ